jgi:hypothetical protein
LRVVRSYCGRWHLTLHLMFLYICCGAAVWREEPGRGCPLRRGQREARVRHFRYKSLPCPAQLCAAVHSDDVLPLFQTTLWWPGRKHCLRSRSRPACSSRPTAN